MIDIWTYIDQNLFIIFISFFILFYTIVVLQNYTGAFFILAIMLLICYFYIMKKEDKQIQNVSIDNYIINLEKMTMNIEIDNNMIYKIHESPRSLRYISRNNLLKNLLYELRPMLIYDKGSLIFLTIYLEYFLKFHYYVMIKRYEHFEYTPILKDIRQEMLNITKSFIFNAPDISPISFDPNIKDTCIRTHNQLKSFTNKYLQILKHKFNKHNMDTIYDPPWEYTKNEHLMY